METGGAALLIDDRKHVRRQMKRMIDQLEEKPLLTALPLSFHPGTLNFVAFVYMKTLLFSQTVTTCTCK
jgi:hypothetical protein